MMTTRKQHKRADRLECRIWHYSIFLLVLLSACVAPQVEPEVRPLIDAGSLTVYLQPLPQETHRLSFAIDKIKALRDDGTEQILVQDLQEIAADQLIGVQKKLLNVRLEPGQYRGLSVTFKEATILGEEGEAALTVPNEPVVAEQAFRIEKRRAVTLFLRLMPERIVTDGFRLTPRLSLEKGKGLLISLKGFVSNTAANSLTVFDTREFRAHDTIAMGDRPMGLAIDQSRELLYVALSGANAIDVVEINNAVVIGKIVLRPGDDPQEIILDEQRQVLMTINPGSRTLSICDTASLTEQARLRLKSEPVDLFRSASGSQAFVLLPDSNSLAFVDYASPGSATVVTVALDETPMRGIVSSDNSAIYLLTRFSSNLLILDRETLSIRERIYVGSGTQDLVEDSDGLIYVAKKRGEIVIVDPAVRAVIDSFAVPPGIRFLTRDKVQNALLAVYPSRGVVQKFDLTGKRSLGVLETGDGAYAATVIGER